jgi:type IV secretory pathway VirD2 relaxase
MSSDLLIFSPKFRRSRVIDRAPTFKHSVLSHVSNSLNRNGKLSSSKHRSLGRGAHFVASNFAASRRVIVKARVVKNTAYGKKANALHLSYIEREGVEKDGSKGHLYGSDSNFNQEHFKREIEGEKHQFRFIVSPEDAHQIELTDYTRELMKAIEHDLETKLEWAAVNHYNTDNPHTHIVVRGLDDADKELRISKNFMSHGFRHRACELMNNELGLRTDKEIQQQKMSEVSQERFTQLDRTILRVANEEGKIFTSKVLIKEADKPVILGRLEKLQQFGLAEQINHSDWHLMEGWEQVLQKMQMRGDIIKTIHQAIKQPHLADYKHFDKSAHQSKISGRLAKIGLSDELYDKFYMVIEGTDSHIHYVDVNKNILSDQIREGHIVSVEMKQKLRSTSLDQVIEQLAEQGNGILRKEETLELGAEKVNKVDYGTMVANRMKTLERMGLANSVDANEWLVVDNLVQRIKRMDELSPIYVQSVESLDDKPLNRQKSFLGYTWLDSLDDSVVKENSHKSQFVNELKAAVENRMQRLKEWGIDPKDANKRIRLLELEKIELAKNQEMLRSKNKGLDRGN